MSLHERSHTRMLMSALVICALAGMVFAATVARADSYAYVAGSTSGSDGALLMYGLGSSGPLAPLDPATAPTGPSAYELVIAPDANHAYDTSSSGVSERDIVDGNLGRSSIQTLPTDGRPFGLAISHDGSYLYAVSDHGWLYQYKVDPGAGSLTLSTTFRLSAPAGLSTPTDVAVSADGRSLYVTNLGASPQGSNVVWQLSVQDDGTLSYKDPLAVKTGDGASSVALSPDGKSAYVTNSGGGTVSEFSVDPADGTLSPKNDTGAGSAPTQIALSPDGSSAYVANGGAPPSTSGSVLQYKVRSDGSLAPFPTPAVQAGTAPSGVAVSADGQSLYVTDAGGFFGGRAGTLYRFAIGAGGALAPTPSDQLPAGISPRRLAVNPPPNTPTPGPDQLWGSARADVICGGGGADTIRGLGGDDRLSGDSCATRATAARAARGGRDVLISGPGDDVLEGGQGADRLEGGPGRDTLRGGPGRDTLRGGPGRDTHRGGPGRDTIDVRRGGRDRVHCGDGRDTVLADMHDVVRSCERIRRR
jgi:DNA-binding beta-propeller fold protein YncE